MSAALKLAPEDARAQAHLVLDECMDEGMTGTVEIHLKRGAPVGAQRHASVAFEQGKRDLMRKG